MSALQQANPADAAKPSEAGAAGTAAKKPMSVAKCRERTTRIHRIARYAVQLLFFILAPGLFSGAFNGVKYLFTQIGLVEGIGATSFVTLLVALLVFTIVFGRFFCGYACAFGTLGDVLFGVFEAARAKLGVARPAFPEKLVKVLSLVKYVVLAGICAACVAGVWSQVSGWSPWVAFAQLTSLSVEGVSTVSLALLGVVAVGMVLRERFFCHFLCPLGAVFSLMPVLGISDYKRTREHCAKGCGRCHAACPVDIWPDADTLGHGECISCGRCADACPMGNVNFIALEKNPSADVGPVGEAGEEASVNPKPVRKTKETWRLLRGSELSVVLGKAALLLAVCWALGGVRYLPPFPFSW